jgi:hypothetical protein
LGKIKKLSFLIKLKKEKFKELKNQKGYLTLEIKTKL